jgi:hypothetical protein
MIQVNLHVAMKLSADIFSASVACSGSKSKS